MELNMVEVVETMLENEKTISAERVASLEKRAQVYEDELVCLKSALADSLRRIAQLETTQQQQMQQIMHQLNAGSPHKSLMSIIGSGSGSGANGKPPQGSSLSNRVSSSASTSRISSMPSSKYDSHSEKSHSNGLNGTIAGENGTKSSKSIKGGESSKAHANGSSSTNGANSKLLALSLDQSHNSAPMSFNSDAGSVKFYLRGRPITLYMPSQLKSNAAGEIGFKFDLETKIKAPKEQLKLEWVYGYRGKDCRSNLYQLPTGELIYFIAATCVLFNPDERTQRHYLGHTDDIKSLCIHPDKITVATGQSVGHDKHEGKAHVRIWDSVTLNTLKVIGLGNGNEFQNSICCLSFSKVDGGNSLAIVDDGTEKVLSVWNWQQGQKQASAKCHNDLVFACEFHPTEKGVLVTCGKQHITFWTHDQQHLTKKNGVFEVPAGAIVTGGPQLTNGNAAAKVDKPKYVLCITFGLNGEVISGDSEGNLIFWNARENKITRVIKEAHESGIFSIYFSNQQASESSTPQFVMITGGGKDSKLVEWNQEYQKTGRVMQIPETNGMCRFITQATKGQSQFYVGTTKNSILRVNFEASQLSCIVNSHTEELWGLTSNPRDSHFLTCGNDKQIYYWDNMSHQLMWSFQLEDPIHSANIHPQFDVCALGTTKAKWLVFDLVERKTIFSQIEGTEQIECVQYSPSGNYLACGSRDNFIYIYAVSENGTKYSRIGRCNGHSSFITHLDWSVDSEYLMSNSGDYETLFWQASTCKQVTQVQQIRELSWKTNNCTLSFNTLAIWNATNVDAVSNVVVTNGGATISNGNSNATTPTNGAMGVNGMDGTDINACAASNNGSLLASVDDFGKVNLFSYPCSGAKCEKRVYSGHSSHVTNVTFVNNDSRLITTGGNDMSVFQWTVITE